MSTSIMDPVSALGGPTAMGVNAHFLKPTADRSPAGLGLDEAATDRVAGQLDAIVHPELLEGVRAVTLDGLFADHQCLSDLVGRVTFGNQLGHLELPRCQRVCRGSLATARTLEVVADQRGHSSGIEERLAAHARSNGFDEIAV